jgi:hypothetical protein
MRRFSLVISLLAVSMTRPVGAQGADYVPAQRLRPGRELVAVYIGSTDCFPCQLPEVKAAVRGMKSLLAAQAKQRRMAFAVIGATQDWDLTQGAAFFDSLGVFDQIVIGGNWTNLAVEQFMLRDSLAELVIPQIVLVERTVELDKRVRLSEPRVLRRINGGKDIAAWFAAGARIAESDDGKPR